MTSRGRLEPVVVVTLLLWSTHLALVAHFAPRGLLALKTPLLTSAFAVDAYRTERALRALHDAARFSTYDPQVLAGQPAGLWEPLGSRALALFSLLAARLRFDPVQAFDALVVSLHAVVPLLGYVAARAHGSSRRVSAGVLATWSLLTLVDGLTHYAWFSGRIQFVVGAALAVVSAALGERALRERHAGWVVGVAVSAALSGLSHPLPCALSAAMIVVGAARARAAAPGRRVAVAVSAAVPVMCLAVALALRGAVTSEPLASVFRVGPSSLFWDLVEIPGPGYGAAGSSRTMLRVLCLGAGALGLARSRDALSPVGLVAIAAVAIAYGGALVPVAWPIDPYFFAIVAAFAASLPAVELVDGVPWVMLLRRGPRVVQIALLAALAVAVPRAARTALTYAPELLPARNVRGPSDFAVSALGGINEPFPDPLGYDPPLPSLPLLAEHLVRGGAAARGRVLTDDASVAGFLALRTTLAVIGPLGERGAASASADPTALLEGRSDAGSIGAFVERYAIGFVVLAGPPGPLDVESPLLEHTVLVQGYRVRRTVAEPSLVACGQGSVESAGLGSIRVSGASGDRITLKYHYDRSLACRPGCVVERAPSGPDLAGFVSVPKPPAAFEIFAY